MNVRERRAAAADAWTGPAILRIVEARIAAYDNMIANGGTTADAGRAGAAAERAEIDRAMAEIRGK